MVFNNRLAPGQKRALIMVDFCRAYFDPDSPFYVNAPNAIEVASNLLQFSRNCGDHIIYTIVEYNSKNSHNNNIFIKKIPLLKKIFDSGSNLRLPVPQLTPSQGDIIIKKQYPSAFFGTTLETFLDDNKVDTLAICGMSASGCVRETAIDAMQRGFKAFVIKDATGDRTPEIYQRNLDDLQDKYAEVLTFKQWETIIKELDFI